MKKQIGSSLLGIIIASTLLIQNPAIAFAAEVDDCTFIPFRSSIVSYLAGHAYETSDEIKREWIRLFEEETGWDGPGKWSDKYYGDYFVYGGGVASSQGVNMTLNSEFSGYFANTLKHNPEFLGELLGSTESGISEIMKSYLSQASTIFPKVEDAILELTSEGKYIGKSKDDTANEMRQFGVDIDVLNIFANRWEELNELQVNWCKSYVDFIYKDFVANHDKGDSIAQKTVTYRGEGENRHEFRPLYDLIARDEVGARSDKYQQEFFDYVIGNPTDINDLPYGLGDWLDKAFGFNDDNINDIQTIYDIFGDEAHCIPGCDKCGGPAGYNNKLAYNISYSNDMPYSKIRDLVLSNKYAAEAMYDWRNHYEYIHSGSSEIATANFSINKYDHDTDFHGFHGGGYTAHCSSHVDATFSLDGIVSSNTSRITAVVQGGRFNMNIYNKKGQRIAGTSGTGNHGYKWWTSSMSISLLGFTNEELEGAYISINVDSSDNATVNNDTCTGAETYASIYYLTMYRTIANCYKTNPTSHVYLTQYKWNQDNTECVGFATCQYDRAHTTIARSVEVIHTEDENYDYYEPVFDNKSVGSKKKVVAKNKIQGGSVSLNLSDPTILSGKTYMKCSSPGVAFHGEGVSQSSSASISFSILQGAIPENTNTLTFNTHCGNMTLVLYYDGEPLMEVCDGHRNQECDRSISVDLSRFSSKQIKSMYAVGTLSSCESVTWCYGSSGTVYHSVSTAALNSVVAAY